MMLSDSTYSFTKAAHVHPVSSLVVIPADSGNVFATRATDIEETTNQAEQHSSALLSSSAATSHSAVSEATITSPYSTQKSTHTIQDVGSPVPPIHLRSPVITSFKSGSSLTSQNRSPIVVSDSDANEDVNEIEESFEQGLKTEKHSDSSPGWSALQSGSLSKSDSRRRSASLVSPKTKIMSRLKISKAMLLRSSSGLSNRKRKEQRLRTSTSGGISPALPLPIRDVYTTPFYFRVPLQILYSFNYHVGRGCGSDSLSCSIHN
ncbi:hypothetical protein F5050DRAFT_1768496 [Lentinula boryana]|uniref:Uncharacterized protein n=1 Tax=Lentinula boryana TaxID=40481 RepID=A0ABQ8QA21_9AGAR|nr:hypothetical protein F5050DRAFT_1768496 [Lentinula boryana]